MRGLNRSSCQVLLLAFKGFYALWIALYLYESGTMNNFCLYLKWQKSTTFIFPLQKHPKTKGARPPVLTLWPITAVLLFSIMLFCPPFFLFLFFHPSISGNEARIRVRIQALWQGSARSAQSQAGLCHSLWARLMIADGQGLNWSSEGVGRSS